MHRGFIVMQIGFVLVALLCLTLLGDAAVAFVFEILVFAPATGLFAQHRIAVRRRPIPLWAKAGDKPTTLPPRKGERLVVTASFICLSVTIGFTLVEMIASPGLVDFPDRRGATFVIAPLAFATGTMLLSSLIDWYVSTPRLSGLVSEPPCLDPDNPRWPAITQLVLVHRWLATFSVIAGLWLSLTALAGVLAYHGALSLLHGSSASHPEAWAGALAAASGLIVAAGGWLSGLISLTAGEYVPALKAGTARGLHPPFAIGDYVAVQPDRRPNIAGYLLDVALEAITIVPSDSIGEGRGHQLPTRLVPTAELEGATIAPLGGPHCGNEECIFINERYCLRAKALRASGETSDSPVRTTAKPSKGRPFAQDRRR